MASSNRSAQIWGPNVLQSVELNSVASMVYVPPPEHKFREREVNELRRPIVIDGVSLGRLHNKQKYAERLSGRGIWLSVLYFTLRGHKTVVLLPLRSRDADDTDNPEYLQRLAQLGVLYGPGGHVKSASARENNYHQIARYAHEMDACIASTHQFREARNDGGAIFMNEKVKHIIKHRLLMPSFSDRDRLDFPPDGPMGRHGESFERTIRCDSTVDGSCAGHQLSLEQQYVLLSALLELEADTGAVYDCKGLMQALTNELQMHDVLNFVRPQSPEPKIPAPGREPDVVEPEIEDEWTPEEAQAQLAPASAAPVYSAPQATVSPLVPLDRHPPPRHCVGSFIRNERPLRHNRSDGAASSQAANNNEWAFRAGQITTDRVEMREKLTEIFGPQMANKVLDLLPDFKGDLNQLVEYILSNPAFIGMEEEEPVTQEPQMEPVFDMESQRVEERPAAVGPQAPVNQNHSDEDKKAEFGDDLILF